MTGASLRMDALALLVTLISLISGSFGRSLSDFEGDIGDGIADDGWTSPTLPVATVIVSVATGISLLIVLALCSCGEQPKNVEAISKTEENHSPRSEENVSPQSEAISIKSSPPNGEPNTTLTQSLSLPHSPPSPNGGASPTEHSPSAMMRASTIERRLPELPPIPPKVPNIGETGESDYNGTYDTIKDGKKKGGGEPKGEVEDPEYNSVEDTLGGRREGPGVAVGVAAASTAMPNGDTGEDDYASVKDTGRPPGMDPPLEGAVGGADEGDNDSSYAKVKDLENGNNGNHPYATVQDKKEKEHGYARVKDIHGNASSDSAPQGAAGGAEQGEDEEVPPVPHKPLDLDSPENPSSPVSQRAGSVSSPGSPDPGRGAPSGTPGGPPDADGPGWTPGPGQVQGPGPGPDNVPIGGPPSGRREPPYTQVSARESLESIRARQQLAHTQKTEEALAAGAGPVAGGAVGGAGQDFDGIYEQVDDNSVRGQNSASPPPLPRGRQTIQVLMGRRVYEEITEDNRPRPPGGAEYSEDPEPYAVVDKMQTDQRPLEASSNSNGNHPEAKGDEKDFDQLYAKVDKSGNKPQHQSNNNNHNHKRVSGDAVAMATQDQEKDWGALYAKVDKNRKSLSVGESRGKGGAVTNFANANGPIQPSAMNSYSDIYADVDENPPSAVAAGQVAEQIVENNYQSIDDDVEHRSPVDERMVHISEHRPNPALWTRREHTYQSVEKNSPKKKKQKKAKDEERKSEKKQQQERLVHNYEVMRPLDPSGVKVEGSRVAANGSDQIRPTPPTRKPSGEDHASPTLVTVKAKNTNNNHMIESLPVKETRI